MGSKGSRKWRPSQPVGKQYASAADTWSVPAAMISEVSEEIENVGNAHDDDENPPTFNDPQPMAKVHVKSAEDTASQRFTVYKNFICYYSDFFEAAFNGNFIEGQTQEITLPDVEPVFFGVFLNWIYTQTLFMSDGKTRPSQAMFLELWLLADRLLAPKLQNAIIRAFESQRSDGKGLGTSLYRRIYESTASDSPLRRYLVDAWDGRKIKDDEDYPQEFLIDLLNYSGAKGVLSHTHFFRDNDLSGYFVSEATLKTARRRAQKDKEAEEDLKKLAVQESSWNLQLQPQPENEDEDEDDDENEGLAKRRRTAGPCAAPAQIDLNDYTWTP